jgi:proton-translocating NAD(P)+ transhydrogenase subunit alpha
MKIVTPTQRSPGETRVALTPAAVKKLVAKGVHVTVEAGAGVAAHHSDDEYRQAGADVATPGDPAELWAQADLLVTIAPPEVAQAKSLRQGAVLVGMLAPLKHADLIRTLAQRQVTAFSMEFVPRISRAQSMDVLSSQASVAGYMAVVRAAQQCPKMFPMMITAAGTIAPARVLVIGAGVAGLQAIATAKRLGAVVEAYDIRAAVKEQVQSLGARFVELPMESADAETAGGYAKEQSDEQRRKQAELMAKHVTGADCVISTAAVFGKAPPMLIPKDVVAQMKPGAVLVDLAADPDAGRGNCEVTKPGQRYTSDNGVVVDGTLNLPALVPVHASQMYANNMLAFLSEIIKTHDGDAQVTLDLEDEVQKGAAITHGGDVVNDMVKQAIGG